MGNLDQLNIDNQWVVESSIEKRTKLEDPAISELSPGAFQLVWEMLWSSSQRLMLLGCGCFGGFPFLVVSSVEALYACDDGLGMSTSFGCYMFVFVAFLSTFGWMVFGFGLAICLMVMS